MKCPPDSRAPFNVARRELTVVAAGGIVLLIGLLTMARIMGMSLSLLPACPWRAVTGIPCPGCGGTRALTCLATGDLRGALLMNGPVSVAALALLTLGAVSLVRPPLAERTLDYLSRTLRTRGARFAIIALLVVQMLVAPR